MSPMVRCQERISVVPVDQESVTSLAAQLSVSPVVATMLVRRGLNTYDACRAFFNPDCADLLDPFLFSAMERAAQRVIKAMRDNEKVVVYGDYDVDGVTATALMIRYLRQLGCSCSYHLPNRLADGYGLSESGVESCAVTGATLMITVDCGIGAVEQVAQAGALGMDVIVTDHHEPKDALPAALAVLDHKVEGCGYPQQVLSGVGMAFKLCQAVNRLLGREDMDLLALLDLVAVGTAADIVPLTGENRVIVAKGFAKLRNSTVCGLRSLVAVQELTGQDLTTSHVVFQLAPCINAVGRLGDPLRGVELLVTENPDRAMELARILVAANRERRALNEQVENEVAAWVQDHCDGSRDVTIVAARTGWHVGVIGIVASRIVDMFHRPTVIVTIGEDGIARGSGRSIPGFHLLAALDRCSDLLTTYGGHAAAAGISLPAEKIPQFRERFNLVAREQLSPEGLVPVIRVDAEVALAELTSRLMRIMKRMGPFGPANMRPVMVSRGLTNRTSPRIVGNGHLKLTVSQNGAVMDAIAFNLGNRLDAVRGADSFGLAYTLDENEWNGKVSLQLKVKGVET